MTRVLTVAPVGGSHEVQVESYSDTDALFLSQDGAVVRLETGQIDQLRRLLNRWIYGNGY